MNKIKWTAGCWNVNPDYTEREDEERSPVMEHHIFQWLHSKLVDELNRNRIYVRSETIFNLVDIK